MVKFSRSIVGTHGLIDRAIEETSNSYHPGGIPMSSVGHDCYRKIYYDLHWVSGAKEFEARMIRLFDTGEIYEERLLDWLEAAEGVSVQRTGENGKQIKVSLAGGWLRGKLDGRARGLVEAPKTTHVVECKSHNDNSFKSLLKNGVKKSKPEHYAQMQSYMEATGDKRALYLAVNKNDDDIYLERVEYDVEYCIRMISKCEAVGKSDTPPPPLHKNPDARNAFDCRFCDHKGVCKGEEFPKSTSCRTCAFVSKESGDPPTWHCDKYDAPLSYKDQLAGCSAHLFKKELVPGELIEFDEETHTVRYKMKNVDIWTDGNKLDESESF